MKVALNGLKQPPSMAGTPAVDTNGRAEIESENTTEARAALERALEGSDMRRLKACLKFAQMHGVAAELLAKAAAKIATAEELEKQADAAEEALLVACEAAAEGGDTNALVVAIARAEEFGADREMIDEAKATLRSRAVLAGGHAQQAGGSMSLDDAEMFLSAAATGEDVDLLEDAIEQARKAGVDEQTVAEAVGALELVRELAEAKQSAEESLAKALLSGHVHLLEATIGLAEDSGVAEEKIEEAKAKLRLLAAAAAEGS